MKSKTQKVLQVSDISVDETKSKQLAFKDEFKDCFTEKLVSYKDVGTGRSTASVEYSTLGNLAKSALEYVLGNAIGAIPIFGPFAADILTGIPAMLYNHYEARQIVARSAEFDNKLYKIGEETIFRVIEETAHEITRIFEYQFAMLKTPSEAKKLAEFAVDSIFEKAKLTESSSKISLTPEGLINALLDEDDSSIFSNLDSIGNKLSSTYYLKTLLDIDWNPKNIFIKSALREELQDGSYTYKTKTDVKIQPKYGYRGAIFEWDNIAKTFIKSSLDKAFSIQVVATDEIVYSYIPYQRLVHQEDIDIYLNSLSKSSKITTFNDFFKHKRNIASAQEVYPVFRDIKIIQDISRADFSNLDMSRVVLTNIEATNSKFVNSRIIASKMTSVNMQGADLQNADLRWGNLYSVNLQGDTILVQTNLKYAIIGKDTDLTDNMHFGRALADDAHVLTTKVIFTILKRLQHQEQREARLAEVMRHLTEKQEAFELQLRQRQSITNSDKISGELYFFNVRQAVEDFTGREVSLARIREHFSTNYDKYAVVVIAAGGGVGKTQITLEYVARNKDIYEERVFWFAAENQETLSENCRDFAQKINIITEKRTDEEILKDVKRKLTTIKNTLFVFDNVDDRELIKSYLPESTTYHHVLITTRDSASWSKNYHVEELLPFSEMESIEYIQSSLPTTDLSETKALANIVGNLPLGLSQSVAYIIDNNLQITEYIDYYNKYRAEILKNEAINDPHISGVYTTFSMAIDTLTSKYENAVEILKICAHLHADSIPEFIFNSMFVSKLEQLKAIAALKSSSLISVKSEAKGRFIYIHRLLQDVIKIKVGGESSQILQSAIKLINAQMVTFETQRLMHNYNQKERIEKNQPMLMHALAVIENYAELIKNPLELDLKYAIDHEIVNLYYACGDLYRTLSRYNNAMEVYQQSLSIIFPYGHEHQDVAQTISYIAEVYNSKSEYNDALEAHEEALRIRKAVLGYNNEKVADSLDNIAAILETQGKYEDALNKYKEALQIRERVYGHINPYVALSLNSIAHVYKLLSKYEEALNGYNEALQIEEVIHGHNHPGLAPYIFSNIAIVYKDQGKYEEALNGYKEALRIRETVYGHDHPEVATSLSSIAIVYKAQGKYEEALNGYKKALRIRETVYGHNHPDVVYSLNNIANVYKVQGKYEEALNGYKEALQIRETVYGHNHPDVASSLDDIAEIYFDQDRYEEAIVKYKEALSIAKLIYGYNHSTVASYLDNIAGAYILLQNDFEMGLKEYKEALLIKETVYGHNHPAVATSLMYIALVCTFQNKYEEALNGYKEALQIRETVYGHNHPDVATSLNSIANVYKDQGKYEEALNGYKEALKIRAAVFPSNHQKLISTMQNIADLLNNKPKQANDKGDKVNGKKCIVSFITEIKYDNPLLNHLELMNAANNMGRVTINKFIKIWEDDKEAAKAIIDAEREYGAVYVLGVIFNPPKTTEQEVLKIEEKPLSSNRVATKALESEQVEQTSLFGINVKECTNNIKSCFSSINYLIDFNWKIKKFIYSQDIGKFNEILRINGIDKSSNVLEDNSDFRKSILLKLHPDKGGKQEDFVFVKELHEKLMQELNLKEIIDEKLQSIQPIIQKASIGFKVLDTLADSIRLINEPELAHAKKVAFDFSYLYGMYFGLNGFSLTISGADNLYQCYEGEYEQAVRQATTTAGYMALPTLIAYAGVPYLGLAYGAIMAGYTGYHAAANVYSLYSEYNTIEWQLKSVVAYKSLYQSLANPPLQYIYDFFSDAKQYEVKVNTINLEVKKTQIKQQLETKGEFGNNKLYEHIYITLLEEKYGLLEAKHVTLTIEEQYYEHCISVISENNNCHYNCYNMEQEILDLVVGSC